MGKQIEVNLQTEDVLQLKGYDPAPGFVVGPLAQTKPSTPSIWFGRKFPSVQKKLGPAFLESVRIGPDGEKRVTPVEMNLDFMAGALGGDERLQHRVVYFQPEQTFHYYDPRIQMFAATSEEKQKLLASQLILKCAQEMSASVDIGPLFGRFRDDDSLRAIVKRARALLAADKSFFSPESPHKRLQGAEVHARITKQFVREAIKPTPGQVLPIEHCFAAFADYCRSKQFTTMARKQFKEIVAEVIKEEFDIGYRHDLQTEEHKYQRGWRGLAVSIPTAVALGRN